LPTTDLETISELKSEDLDTESTDNVVKEEGNKVPSPPVKSYYRHDLCDSESDNESKHESKAKSRLDSDEGYFTQSFDPFFSNEIFVAGVKNRRIIPLVLMDIKSVRVQLFSFAAISVRHSLCSLF